MSGYALRLWNHAGCIGWLAFEATTATASPSLWPISGDVRFVPLLAPGRIGQPAMALTDGQRLPGFGGVVLRVARASTAVTVDSGGPV